MARPTKCRKVCSFPRTLEFQPVGEERAEEAVVLTVDEYETIRLMDYRGLSQEECALSMQVARTTVQKVYESARRKLAASLVDGRPLHIRGGEYQLCNGQNRSCPHGQCALRSLRQQYEPPKGETIMRIAATYENGQIFQHFGHTEQFKIYDVEEGKIISSEVVDTNGSGHGALAGMLSALHVDALICGGIGGGAQMALAQAGIRLYGGVQGSADAAAEALAENRLTYDPAAKCDHHDHHHGEGHTCGNHGCGGEHHCNH